MADKPKSSNGVHTCALCGANSDERVLLSAEQKGKPIWVCVRCMPVLIHGEQQHAH